MSISADFAILEWINHNRIEPLDEVIVGFSYITTFVSVGLVFVILLISLLRKQGYKYAIQLTATLLVTAFLSFTIKTLTNRERPFETYESIEKLSTGGSSSFPSGHTFEAFAVAMAISLMYPRRKVVIPIMIWAVLVGYSRMALGVHYPTDVLAGMILGILLAWGIDYIFRLFTKKPRKIISE